MSSFDDKKSTELVIRRTSLPRNPLLDESSPFVRIVRQHDGEFDTAFTLTKRNGAAGDVAALAHMVDLPPPHDAVMCLPQVQLTPSLRHTDKCLDLVLLRTAHAIAIGYEKKIIALEGSARAPVYLSQAHLTPVHFSHRLMQLATVRSIVDALAETPTGVSPTRLWTLEEAAYPKFKAHALRCLERETALCRFGPNHDLPLPVPLVWEVDRDRLRRALLDL